MNIIGNPQGNNAALIAKIKTRLEFSSQGVVIDKDFFTSFLDSNMTVLDVGQSLRENFSLVAGFVNKIDTLDINVFENYPDIQMDLCERSILPENLKYDVIFCFSLLEHCYNPFIAGENLFKMLKPNSRIVGSVPFLFPQHCPEDLSYQDYFRFTKYSFISLFPDAEKIKVWPHRGRVGTGLNIISQRYKDIVEKRLPRLARRLNSLGQKKRPEQSSGFGFEVLN
jgi:SAM-dependent methyltransferase